MTGQTTPPATETGAAGSGPADQRGADDRRAKPIVDDAMLGEVASATSRVLATARSLSDDAVRAPSALPGWTRGHVLTHLARNADGMGNLVEWAVTGTETPMYESRERRDSDIEAGAGRSASALVADVEAASQRLAEALVELSTCTVDRELRTGSGAALPASGIPSGRIRELEIHHVDLAAGYSPDDWSVGFAVRTLDQLAELFATQRDTPVEFLEGTDTGRRWRVGSTGGTLRGPEQQLVAWLTGRSDGGRLVADPPRPVPAAPRWV